MWEISNRAQAVTFLYAMVLGGILCLFYDIFKAVHKTSSHGTVAVFFGDLVYWTVSAFVTFLFLLSRTNGEIRGYVLFAMFAGFVAVRLTLSKLWLVFIESVFSLLLKVKKIIHGVFNRFLMWFSAKIHRFSDMICRKWKKYKKKIKKTLEK